MQQQKKAKIFFQGETGKGCPPLPSWCRAADDQIVQTGHNPAYAAALIKNNVRCKLHVYPAGGHGFGMNKMGITDQWQNGVLTGCAPVN